jgi:hypothetical protein
MWGHHAHPDHHRFRLRHDVRVAESSGRLAALATVHMHGPPPSPLVGNVPVVETGLGAYNGLRPGMAPPSTVRHPGGRQPPIAHSSFERTRARTSRHAGRMKGQDRGRSRACKLVAPRRPDRAARGGE